MAMGVLCDKKISTRLKVKCYQLCYVAQSIEQLGESIHTRCSS